MEKVEVELKGKKNQFLSDLGNEINSAIAKFLTLEYINALFSTPLKSLM
jgi:hypothetical protein